MRGIYKRWIYMIIAVAAAATLLYVPIFSFQGDKGVISERTYSMDHRNFYVKQTKLETGDQKVVGTVSVRGLYYTGLAMLGTSILCFLCFFSDRWRIRLTLITVGLAGAYYAFMVFYAVKISNEWYPTLYPNLAALLPAIVLEMMVLTRKNLLQEIRHSDEKLNY